MGSTWRWLFLGLLAWTCAVTDAQSEVPHVVTFQGRLKDSLGIPHTGSKLVKFTLYDKSGLEIWNSGFLSQTFSQGLVTVQLGAPPQPALPPGPWASDTGVTLGVTVDSDPEISPRIRFTAGGYAFHSLDADKLDGQDASAFAGATHTHALDNLSNVTAPTPGDGQVLTYNSGSTVWEPRTPPAGGGSGWTDDGNAVRLTTGTDRVGVGTASPTAKLQISGKGTDGKSFNANDVLVVVPDSPFVGINRDFKVIPQEVFGVHSPRTGYGGMFMSVPTVSDVPFFGYSAGGALHAYHYYDAIKNRWNLWNHGKTRLAVDSAGQVEINPNGLGWPHDMIPARLKVVADTSDGAAGYFLAPAGTDALRAISNSLGMYVEVPDLTNPVPVSHPTGINVSCSAVDEVTAWTEGIRSSASGIPGTLFARGVLAFANGADENTGLYGSATGETGVCRGITGVALGQGANKSVGGYFSSDEWGIDVEVGREDNPTIRNERMGARISAWGDGSFKTFGVSSEALGGNIATGVLGHGANGTDWSVGLMATVAGSAPTNFGVHAVADAYGTKNYGIRAAARNATTNFAGFFTKGTSGQNTPASNSVVVMENDVNSYLSILGPDIYEKGILFGQPSNEAAGGVIYNAGGVTDGLSFRTLNNSTKMVITSAGYVGINTTAPSQRLQVGGNICYTGSIAACSDARYKTDVQPLSGSLDRVMQMRGVAYRWRTEEYPERDFDEAGHLGFIAQELEALYPELVLTDAEGYRSVDYGRLTPVLVEAIKEQQGKIDRLQSQLELLTEMVKDLAAERNSLDRQKAGL